MRKELTNEDLISMYEAMIKHTPPEHTEFIEKIKKELEEIKKKQAENE